MKINDVLIAFVPFTNQAEGKRRPVLLVKKDTTLTILRITSKFQTKSPQIQKKYFEILDLSEAGLHKPSWIDVGEALALDPNKISTKVIGKLSIRDKQRLRLFIQNLYSE